MTGESPDGMPGTTILDLDHQLVKSCRVSICTDVIYARKLCLKHYRRYMNHGNTNIAPAGKASPNYGKKKNVA